MKNSKSMLSMLLTFVLMLSLTGCGEGRKAENAVDQMFVAFKSLDFEEMPKYVNLEDVNKIVSERDEKGEVPERVRMIAEKLSENLSYEIISSEKIDKNKALVKTKITAIDMEPVLTELWAKMVELAFSSAFSEDRLRGVDADKKMEEMLLECLSKSELSTVTNEVNIQVVKTKRVWKIEPDDELANALFGGIVEFSKKMEERFSRD